MYLFFTIDKLEKFVAKLREKFAPIGHKHDAAEVTLNGTTLLGDKSITTTAQAVKSLSENKADLGHTHRPEDLEAFFVECDNYDEIVSNAGTGEYRNTLQKNSDTGDMFFIDENNTIHLLEQGSPVIENDDILSKLLECNTSPVSGEQIINADGNGHIYDRHISYNKMLELVLYLYLKDQGLM